MEHLNFISDRISDEKDIVGIIMKLVECGLFVFCQGDAAEALEVLGDARGRRGMTEAASGKLLD